MAQLLVRVVDKTHPNPELDRGLTKRGDVIAVVEDGHVWGTEELKNPDWRIIVIPGVPTFALASLAHPESPELGYGNGRRRRANKFDVDAPSLPGPMKQYLADASRAQPTYTLSGGLTRAFELRIRKGAN